MEALSLYRRKEYVEAEKMFREVETQHPKITRKWELYSYGAENETGLRNSPAAMAWYKRAAETGDKKRQRSDALRRLGDAHVASKDYASAQAAYAQALKREDIGSRRLDLALQRGEALEQLKRYDEALAWYDRWRPYAVNEKREGDVLIRRFALLSGGGGRGSPSTPSAAKAGLGGLGIQPHDRSDTLAALALTDTIASRYRKTRYAESALYLWRQWSGRVDARTALLDSMIAN